MAIERISATRFLHANRLACAYYGVLIHEASNQSFEGNRNLFPFCSETCEFVLSSVGKLSISDTVYG